jgi:hypothetical protein
MADIEQVCVELSTNLRKLKQEVGIELKERVEQRTPVGETGRLRRGWGFTLRKTSLDVYNTVEYAEYVEYGTPHMAPRGMLRATLLELPQIVEVAAVKAGVKK